MVNQFYTDATAPAPHSEWVNRPRAGQVAEACARVEWRVFPALIDHRGRKQPVIKGWKNLATTDLDVIDEWWSGKYARCVAGVATGQTSNLLVVDLDRKNGHDGYELLTQLEREHGSLPRTWRVRTRDGEHRYYSYPARTGITISGGGGLDIRGEGGLVIAPGTQVHDWEGYRAWEYVDSILSLPLPELPAWFVDWAVNRRRNLRRPHSYIEGNYVEAVGVEDWIDDAASVAPGGQESYLFTGLRRLRRTTSIPPDTGRGAACGAAICHRRSGRSVDGRSRTAEGGSRD
jgi:hypothetical protein